MYRYFIKLSYKGTRFHGWQIQPNSESVQEEVNKALSIVLKEKINVAGAGRTDTGVHAKVFYAHFDLNYKIDNQLLRKLDFKLNSILHKDIAIYKIFEVDGELHSRFSAKKRVYKYFVVNNKDPFSHDTAWYLSPKLNIKKMNQAAAMLLNYDDFTSFAKLHSETKTNICKIYNAKWDFENNKLVFTIAADRFLRNMVRAIVGTLVDVGMDKTSLDEFKNIIESKNRSNAGASSPANGLFLWDIDY
jgi:tRNA pseudouridine38-40 synthase